MTRISKYKVEDKVLRKLYFLMFEIISNIDEEERFEGIMNELLSPTEKIMIAKRVAIVYLLMKNIDYLIISDVLKVSSRTI
jgi:Trp operon repressor